MQRVHSVPKDGVWGARLWEGPEGSCSWFPQRAAWKSRLRRGSCPRLQENVDSQVDAGSQASPGPKERFGWKKRQAQWAGPILNPSTRPPTPFPQPHPRFLDSQGFWGWGEIIG
jgi:hypothetical protein